jgi:hypothetical protein
MRTINKLTTSALLVGFGITLLFACKKDKQDPETPTVVNEEEMITTVELVFTDTFGADPVKHFFYKDLDGAGGNNPSIYDTIRLLANTTYQVSILLRNESVSPAEDHTVEIQEEASDHLFCFVSSSGLNLGVVITDSDGTLPLGLQSNWTTQGISTGHTLIRLKHQPGIKTGDCSLGETDVELNFVTFID